MKITNEDSFRDGGTKSYITDTNKEYCIDYRVEADPDKPGFVRKRATAGEWFDGYPKNDNSNRITDEDLLSELIDALDVYKASL